MNLTLLQWLTPWEFSPVLVALFVLAAFLFVRGSLKRRVNGVRQALFWTGFILLYLSLHTYVDYYAERVFFIHRLQHLVLHHLGPLLIMASYPTQVFKAGLPRGLRRFFYAFRHTRLWRGLYAVGTHKIFIPFMFVFLVLVWLEPTVQFYSMLDWRIYRLMNWSVVVSGFLYWNLILDRRPSIPATITARSRLGRWWQRMSKAGYPAVMSHRERIFSPLLTMLPQAIVGALIAFSSQDLYPLFELCGRAVPITAQEDQMIGGIIMWIPAAAVETTGFLVAIFIWMNLSAKGRVHRQ